MPELFKDPIDNFKPSPWRILIIKDRETTWYQRCYLSSHKLLAILDGGKQNTHFGPNKIFEKMSSQS